MLTEQEVKDLIKRYEAYANNPELTVEQRDRYSAMVAVLTKVLEE